MDKSKLTPAMRQYMNIKEQYPDSILFFRLGDFYELFFDDAIEAHSIMEVVLTSKACGLEEKAPMCGVPYHAADTYIAKLIEKGRKVAICEQMEDPALAKGIVKREVVRIVTPGTVISPSMLSASENNFLASLYIGEEGIGIAYCDISTGEFRTLQVSGKESEFAAFSQLAKIDPREIITNFSAEELYALNSVSDSTAALFKQRLSPSETGCFRERQAGESIRKHFNVESEKSVGLGREDFPLLYFAVGGLLCYLNQTQKQDLSHLKKLGIVNLDSHMNLDRNTLRNLELTESLFERKREGSLLGVLDKTMTAMGARMLRSWLISPLTEEEAIEERLEAVDRIYSDALLRNDLREAMRRIYDLERLAGRIAYGSAGGRELVSLKSSIDYIPEIKGLLGGEEAGGLLARLAGALDPLADISALIGDSIVEEPPAGVKEGGIIREGYSEHLDRLKEGIREGKEWIAALEGTERERTGIKNLKVGYNKVFGYYIEVTKTGYDLIPEDYIRKQTLVNCERFITPRLKEVENEVLGGEAKIFEEEYRIFSEVREEVKDAIPRILSAAEAVAAIDVLSSFAEASSRLGYVRPKIHAGDEIIIERGRHPVIEVSAPDGIFISNDVYMDRDSASLLLITGPNMSGKSTYMRQCALIVLMAQAGCFVPAERAEIGICDRIYTRIGASDNLAQGESTFFVEMSELAYILNTASARSLLILDEIGRGTSTYDGLSIAGATVEYLADPKRRIRTLFATHYHELTFLAERYRSIKNLTIAIAEEGDRIVFLHKIMEGSASRSYGIHVAGMAGVPDIILERAEEKLTELETFDAPLQGTQVQLNIEMPAKQSPETGLDNEILSAIMDAEPMNMTPSEAIATIVELKKLAEKRKN